VKISVGEDIRWNTPISGLTIGSSVSIGNLNGYGKIYSYPVPDFYISEHNITAIATYADYVHNKWHFAAEFRPTAQMVDSWVMNAPSTLNLGNKALFVSGAYRVNKHLEVGSYNSRLYIDQSSTPSNLSSTHIFDQAVTARIDLTNFWNVKVEGHFIDGYGDVYSARGFYPANNLTGLKPTTDMVVVRTGINF
jgi:hypothetical protein